jgi:hypothetical protein
VTVDSCHVTGTAAYTTGTVLRMCFSYFGWVGVNPFLQDRYARPNDQHAQTQRRRAS